MTSFLISSETMRTVARDGCFDGGVRKSYNRKNVGEQSGARSDRPNPCTRDETSKKKRRNIAPVRRRQESRRDGSRVPSPPSSGFLAAVGCIWQIMHFVTVELEVVVPLLLCQYTGSDMPVTKTFKATSRDGSIA